MLSAIGIVISSYDVHHSVKVLETFLLQDSRVHVVLEVTVVEG